VAQNNLFNSAAVNTNVTAAPVQAPAMAQQQARLPFGYVVGFPTYTAATTVGTMGVENTQTLMTQSDSSFEVFKQYKWDSGGGNGYIKILSNQNISVYGISNVNNDFNGYANINTVFGNSQFVPLLQQPLVLPPSRQLSITYRDVTTTAGNLYVLLMGNKLYPAGSYYANSTYVRTVVPTGSYPKQYTMTLKMASAYGTASGTISIPQGQNFVWTGVSINDAANPVTINFSVSQMSNQSIFSQPVISRMISGTENSNSPASGITLAGVRPFMFPSFINLVENSSVNVIISDIMNTSGYLTDITLWGYITQQTGIGA
jgi:hypothetical protein